MSDSGGRILLFGATGYTGRITASILAKAGAAPVLVGRSASAVQEMVHQLSPDAPVGREPTHAVADANEPETLRALVESPNDVLISTVGPFQRLGHAAVEAVVEAGAAYADSAGEPSFIREVFERHGRRAERSGARLVPAMGYDFAPGNLASSLLIARYDPPIEQIDVGYFVRGPYSPSSGTVGTMAGIVLAPSYSLKSGQILTQRTAAGVRSFRVGDAVRDGVSIGGTEQFTLRAIDPVLRDVNVYVGWTGRWSRAASAAGVMTSNAMQVPGLGTAVGAVMRATVGGASDTGPAAHQRARATSFVVAESPDPGGGPTRRVQVEGPNPYDLTGQLLAWSATMLSHRMEKNVGAMGPVTAFGHDAFVAACMAVGLMETNPSETT
jgi:short subunit dehydrogenase-like uncharacterized protein